MTLFAHPLIFYRSTARIMILRFSLTIAFVAALFAVGLTPVSENIQVAVSMPIQAQPVFH